MDKDLILYAALGLGAYLILNKTSVAVFGSGLLSNAAPSQGTTQPTNPTQNQKSLHYSWNPLAYIIPLFGPPVQWY